MGLSQVEAFKDSEEFINFLSTGIAAYSSNAGALLVRTKEFIENEEITSQMSTQLLTAAIEFSSSVIGQADFNGFVHDRSLIASNGIQMESITERPGFPLPMHELDTYADFSQKVLRLVR